MDAAPIRFPAKLKENRRHLLGAAVLGLLVAILYGFSESHTQVDAVDLSKLSVAFLLRSFEDTKEYLQASGWQKTKDGTFEPKRKVRVEKAMIRWRPIGIKRFTKQVSQKKSCDGVKELHHISAVLPGLDPTFVMEALMNPSYGVKWNPSISRVLLRKHHRIRRDTSLVNFFTPEVIKSSGSDLKSLARDPGDSIDVTAQVTEMPLPALVQRAIGRRYTADFIASRFDCEAKSGFSIATSKGTEEVAKVAGVDKGQELCLNTMTIAPVGGAVGGTAIHFVSHFNPKVRSKMMRNAVNLGVGRSVRNLFHALDKKARALQAAGKHPFIDCPS
eukprot:TRINITY_DN25946_c0_g1_i2.p1 TRINITY_DN25946_c0_g1~~TRINITY_DN25946_c0_g1_i2.p1  ORF type:complete len:331 (+),score=48.24 TRINITY_DN25946_c0_g1_i2:93-1085(+)